LGEGDGVLINHCSSVTESHWSWLSLKIGVEWLQGVGSEGEASGMETKVWQLQVFQGKIGSKGYGWTLIVFSTTSRRFTRNTKDLWALTISEG
jgi:hypothetical protein